MRALQPEGPYLLGGWSFGGMLAYEMARQLRASGQEVGMLAILDTVLPWRAMKVDDEADLMARRCVRMAKAAETYLRLKVRISYEELLALAPQEQLVLLGERVREADPSAHGVAAKAVMSRVEVFFRNIEILRAYKAEGFDGPVTFFRAALPVPVEMRDLEFHLDDVLAGWDR